MWHRWQAGCGKLPIYAVKPKAVAKIAKERVIANKPTKVREWNHIQNHVNTMIEQLLFQNFTL